MKKEQALREEAAADAEFDALLEAIADIRKRLSGRSLLWTQVGGNRTMTSFPQLASAATLASVSSLAKQIPNLLAMMIQPTMTLTGNEDVLTDTLRSAELAAQAVELLPRCSAARRVNGASAGIEPISAALPYLRAFAARMEAERK